MPLPRFMVLASDVSGRYLSCHGKAKDSTCSSLSFCTKLEQPNLDVDSITVESLKKKEDEKKEEAETQFHLLKFEVEESKSVPGLVHIRTCYNNKYWIRESEESRRIVAEANEPQEDQTKWCCTLFKPICVGELSDEESPLFGISKHGIGKAPQKIQLMHATTEAEGKQYYIADDGSEELQLVNIDVNSKSELPVTFSVSDVGPTAILPKYFTLMGNDGKYLGTPDGYGLWFRFTDAAEKGVAMWNPTELSVPGVLYFRSKGFSTYWYINQENNWRDNVGLHATWHWWFYPVKVDNHVALYSVHNKKFLVRTGSGDDSYIKANSSNLTNEVRLRVGEPVISRTILSADYKLEDARTYGTSIIDKFVDSRSNYTSVEQTGTFEVSYVQSQTTSWNQSVTVNIGISTSWSFGIPFVGEGGIEVSYERGETWEWGEQKTDERTVKYTQNLVVPPMTKVTLQVMATKAYCDVPFHCLVSDLMTDGTRREYTKTDGLYTGVNEFGFNTVKREERL